MNKEEIKEYEYDFQITNENKEALEKLRKEYGVHWFKMKLEDGTELNLVEKVEYDLLKQENKQLKERIDKAIEYITSEEYFWLNNQKTGSFCEDSNNYMKAHDKLLKILKGEE